jgi:hypothetical protein
MLHWLYTYVVSVWFKCFSYFKRILQVFYLNLAYVASVCCKCFICFGHMLQQMIYVASVPWAGAAKGRRRRWSPRVCRRRRRRGAQSCIHARGNRRGAWSCIHRRLAGMEHEVASMADSRCKAWGEAEHKAASVGALSVLLLKMKIGGQGSNGHHIWASGHWSLRR